MLFQQHYDALEVDFRREYHLDLAESCWGANPLDGRKVIALVRHLPPDSATSRALEYEPSPVTAPAAVFDAPVKKKASATEIREFFASGPN